MYPSGESPSRRSPQSLLAIDISLQVSARVRFSRSTVGASKLKADLAEVFLGFLVLKSSRDLLQRKAPIDYRFQIVCRNRPNHIFLISSAANRNSADTNLSREYSREQDFA